MSNAVQWVVEFDIKDGELENLKAVMNELVAATKANEPGPADTSPSPPLRPQRITDSWHSSETLMQQLSLPDTSFLVAEMKGTVVGHIYANAQKPPVLTIARLYVLPDRRLLHEVTTGYPACDVVRLVVEAENAKGLAFYEREGFHPVGQAIVEGIRHLRMERPGPASR